MPTGKQKRIKKRLDRRQKKVDESRATFGTNDPDLGKFDRRLNRLKRTVSQAENQGMDVDYDTTNASGEGTVKKTSIYSGFKPGSEMTSETRSRLSSDKYKAPTQMGHSSLKMESAKQERKNLLDINPIAKHASGSWMSKHSKSAFHMGHSPAEMGHDSPAKNIDPKKIKKEVARIATGAIMPGLTPEVAKAAFNAAKKVGKEVKKVAKRIKHDMTGGFEHARKRRQMRGGK